MTSSPLICFSHLRWDSVFQRPQHLMTRCARERRVYYVEEPVESATTATRIVATTDEGVTRVVPHLAPCTREERHAQLHLLLERYFRAELVTNAVLWYYTPAALAFTRDLSIEADAVVYDCMDELSAFLGASPDLETQERELFRRADLVFTGGRSLFEAKRRWHPSTHCFPSSVEVAHFAQARTAKRFAPPDQSTIARPRAGFFGVLDERLDRTFVADLADARPHWQFVYLGPVAKIDPADLPRRDNIHYLGQKRYDELPFYAGGWDAALVPFALNAATRFISPTKTLEYLAAGLPVVSTPIADVVSPYGELGLVSIARTGAEAAVALDGLLQQSTAERARQTASADRYLSSWSWDATWQRMHELILAVSQQTTAQVTEVRRRA